MTIQVEMILQALEYEMGKGFYLFMAKMEKVCEFKFFYIIIQILFFDIMVSWQNMGRCCMNFSFQLQVE